MDPALWVNGAFAIGGVLVDGVLNLLTARVTAKRSDENAKLARLHASREDSFRAFLAKVDETVRVTDRHAASGPFQEDPAPALICDPWEIDTFLPELRDTLARIDPAVDRAVIDSGGLRTTVVGVGNADQLREVAAELVADGHRHSSSAGRSPPRT